MAGIGGKGTGGERKQSRRERQLPQMSIRKIAFRVCVPRDGFAVSQIGVSIGVGFYTHVFNLQTDTLIVGGTPSVLIGIGFPSLPITISQVNLKANINGQYRGTPAEILDHVISSADFKKLPELISDPVAIIADRRLQHNKWTVSEHIVDVLVEMEINGKQTQVPIKIDGKGMQNGATIDALSISSVHGNRDAYDRLSYALENDDENHILTFYVNKSKATAVLQKAGHTITGWPNISNGFNHSITDSNSPVKLRITSQTESIDRKNGGLKYTADEKAAYLFQYTERSDGVKYSGRTKTTLTNDRVQDRKDKKRITISMTDSERTEILNGKVITAAVYEGQADKSIEVEMDNLKSYRDNIVKAALVRIGEEFGVFTDYRISDVELDIRLSKSNLKESISKKVDAVQIAKLLPIMESVIGNAVGIECHANRYFYDNNTVMFENLLGGYVDGDYFVPIRFGLKHSRSGKATLYLVVDQHKIDIKKIKAEVTKTAVAINTNQNASRSAFMSVYQM